MPLPECVIDDHVARIAINILVKLKEAGVHPTYAKNVAVEWLAKRCGISRVIAFEVHNCLINEHTVCSHGNNKDRDYRLCKIEHSSCEKRKL